MIRLIVLPLLLVPAPALAQESNDDLRRELADLRQRIARIEAKLDARRSAATAASEAPPPPAAPPPPISGGTTAAKDERRRQAHVERGELPLGTKTPTYWTAPGAETQIRISGLVRFGAYKDLIDNIGSWKFLSGAIHPRGDPRRQQGGNIQAQMHLTRLNIDSDTPTALGPLETTISVDFAGGEPVPYAAEALQQNGYHARLFQAHGKLGPFRFLGLPSELLVGQTWSNFVDDPDTAESIDASGPASVPSERQPQIRYTARWRLHAMSIALENPIGDYQRPELTPTGGSSFNNTSSTNRWPDVSLKYETEQAWGRAQLSAVLRRFAVDDGLGHRASALGYGFVAGGTLDLRGRDRIGGEAWFGDGIGKYIPDDFGTPNGFAVSGYGTDRMRAVTQRSFGLSLWYRHYWASEWHSNLALGVGRQVLAPFIMASVDQAPEVRTAQINLFYAPLPIADFGVELKYGSRAFRPVLRLPDADALRLGFSARFKIN